MKRVVVGLGMGVLFLLFLVGPILAFDRDVHLPSNNASDPVWMYNSEYGDEGGWTDPQQVSGIITTDVKTNLGGKDIDSTRFLFNMIWMQFNHLIRNIWIQINAYEDDNQQELGQSQTASGR